MPRCSICNDKRSIWDESKKCYVPCPSCNSDGNVYKICGESIEPSEGSAHAGCAEESLEVEGYERIPGE
jgi:hypothetical protein